MIRPTSSPKLRFRTTGTAPQSAGYRVRVGSISLEAMSPPAGSLTPWRGISGELARNAPNYMSRIHGRAAPDHAIVNEKAARSAITETATE